MYFRFPVLMILIGLLIGGFLYVRTNYLGARQPANNSHVSGAAPSAQPSVETSDAEKATLSVLATIRENELRAHIAFLANDLLEGRDTGSRGSRLAAAYIANQFERIGLTPVGEDSGYFQTVHLVESRVLPSSELSVQVDSVSKSFDYGSDFLVVAIPPQKTVSFEGELVFTGFGIQAPEYDYDDFEGLDVKEKVTVYVSGEPPSDREDFFEGEKVTGYSNGPSKRATARKLGAGASLGIIRPETLDRVSWDSYRGFFTQSRLAIEDRAARPSQSYFPAIVLHPGAAEHLFRETEADPEQLLADWRDKKQQFTDLHGSAHIKILAERNRIFERNVVGFLEGLDPDLKSELIIFTAHYDHVGIGSPAQGDSIYNGAADNASGVAGLIELAEAFSAPEVRARRSILFLAVTAEEKGLLGSEYYVNYPLFPLHETVANINLDILGVGDSSGVVIYGLERSSLGEVFTEAAAEIGLSVMEDELPEQRIFYRSDHYSFAKKGVPAIYPSFGMRRESFPEFQSFYHRPHDDPTLPFNLSYMKKHVQLLFLAGLRVANSDSRPQWAQGDEFQRPRPAN